MDDDWDMSDSDDESLGGGSAISDADAPALGVNTQPPEFYDPDADDKDEAWAERMRRAHHSDAILSCPLCFTTLCIDCQQHEKYDHQFRAMFVMNCRVKTGEVVTLPSPPDKRGKQQRKQQRKQQGAVGLQQGAAGQQEGAAGQQRGAVGQQQQQQQQGGGMQPLAALQGAVQQPAPGQPPNAAAGAAAAQPGAPAAAAGEPALRQRQGAPGPIGGSSGEGPLHPVCCAVCDTEVGLRVAGEGVYHFFSVFASTS